MAIFSTFSSRWSTAGALAALCVTGAICGLLYAYIFFGTEPLLLLPGALAGAFITLFYGLLELKIFPQASYNQSITRQYVLRVVCYYVLFLVSLLLISLLHAGFSHLYSNISLINIFLEDYLPLWPAYLIYALLAAFVFQSAWLFNKVNSKADTFSRQNKTLKTTTAAVFVIALRSAPNVSQDRIIAILHKLSSAMLLEKNGLIEYYENGKLNIYFGEKPLSHDEVMHWEKTMYNQLNSHISTDEKMLQLEMGYAFADIHLQICGTQTIFYGEAVQRAEQNLKIVQFPGHHLITPAPSFPYFV